MSYRIRLSKDHTCFDAEADETLLQAAIRNNVRLPYGCNNGLCYGCLQTLSCGETEYREDIDNIGGLLDKQTMLCRAYAKSDVVIDAKQLPSLPDKDHQNTDKDIIKAPLADSDPAQSPAKDSRYTARVIVNRLVCDDTREIHLQLSDAGFTFVPGQYINVVLADGQYRSFSIAHFESATNTLVLYIKYVDGGYFTTYVFNTLELGETWTITGALGSFTLDNNDRPILMLATSTGIVPLMAMLQQLYLSGDQRRIYLYFGVRYPSRLFADHWLTTLALSYPPFSYTPVVSRPKAQQTPTPWQGRQGYVQHTAIADFSDLSAVDIYASGSPTMIASTIDDCIQAGASSSHLHLDVFNFQHPHND